MPNTRVTLVFIRSCVSRPPSEPFPRVACIVMVAILLGLMTGSYCAFGRLLKNALSWMSIDDRQPRKQCQEFDDSVRMAKHRRTSAIASAAAPFPNCAFLLQIGDALGLVMQQLCQHRMRVFPEYRRA